MWQKISNPKWLGAIIFIAAFALYANTIPNGYNMDDELVTINHPRTSKGLQGISEIIASFYYEDAAGYKYGYRPVTHISFAIEHAFFGENVHVSHTINVVLYSFSCLLIFLVMRLIFYEKSVYLPFLIALIFAIHPLHTEVVASIKNRDEILSLLFGILGLYTVLKMGASNKSWMQFLTWIAALGFFVLGMYSKKSILFFSLFYPVIFFLRYPKSSLLIPMLFTLVASLLSADILNIGQPFNAYYAIASLISIIVLKWSQTFLAKFDSIGLFVTAVQNKWAALVHLISRIFQHKFTAYGIAVGGICALTAASYESQWILYIIGFILLFVSIYLIRFTADKWVLSMVLYVGISISGGFLGNVDWIPIAFVFTILFNWHRIRLNKLVYFLVPVFSAICFLFAGHLEEWWGAFIFGGMYLLQLKSPKWLLIVPVIFLLNAISVNFLVALAGLLYLFVVALYCFKDKFEFINRNQKSMPLIILVALPAVISIMVGSSLLQLDANTTEPYVEHVEQDFTPLVERVKNEDRPILVLENPLIENWNWQSRCAAAVSSSFFYLKKLIVPHPLAFYYGYNAFEYDAYSSGSYYLKLACLILTLFLGFYFWISRPMVGWSIMALLLCLLPYSNLFTPISGMVGDRLAYTASFWFALVLAYFLYSIWLKVSKEKVLKIGFLVVLFAALIVSSAYVIHRNTFWKSRVVLFSNDVKVVPNSAQAHGVLANAIMQQVDPNASDAVYFAAAEKAIAAFEKAVAIYPGFLNWWYDKGTLYEELGDVSNAVLSYQKAIELDPEFSAEVYVRMGNLLPLGGYYEDAIAYQQEAIRLGYKDPVMYVVIAANYQQLNNEDQALLTLKEGLKLYPNDPKIMEMLLQLQ